MIPDSRYYEEYGEELADEFLKQGAELQRMLSNSLKFDEPKFQFAPWHVKRRLPKTGKHRKQGSRKRDSKSVRASRREAQKAARKRNRT